MNFSYNILFFSAFKYLIRVVRLIATTNIIEGTEVQTSNFSLLHVYSESRLCLTCNESILVPFESSELVKTLVLYLILFEMSLNRLGSQVTDKGAQK
jgi:hypothetical protein